MSELTKQETAQLNLTALQKLIQAATLINEVNNTNTDFTDTIMPSCTEEFLKQLSDRLTILALEFPNA